MHETNMLDVGCRKPQSYELAPQCVALYKDLPALPRVGTDSEILFLFASKDQVSRTQNPFF